MSLSMLIVEDDDGLRPSLVESFSRRGYDVLEARSVAEALPIVRGQSLAVVLLDIHLPDGLGLEILRELRSVDDDAVVILMTAFPEIKTAIAAIQEGASDFVVKPFELTELQLAVDRTIEIRALRRQVRRLGRERKAVEGPHTILGESAAILKLRSEIAKVAETDAPVLIVGPTGVGKELVADAIHAQSPRSKAPLIKVNCSAISEHLLESELFGHEKGAFTDAREGREGLFEMADGGTLFLDEVSEMKPELQAKLLRVVEGHPFRRIGGKREIQTDVRILAATNRDLQESIRATTFRQDLYFRLNVFSITVPPVRDRGEDVILLAEAFLERFASTLRKGPMTISADAKTLLLRHDWPGNVRELKNLVERAAILADANEVTPEVLPRELSTAGFLRTQQPGAVSHIAPLSEVERRYIEMVLEFTGGNLSQAARALGVARNTLKAKLGSER